NAGAMANFNLHICRDGLTATDFRDNKIKELSVGNRDAFHTADLGNILQKHLCWKRNLPHVTPFYAMKCNNSLPILSMLADLGTSFDCASPAEIQSILSLDVHPSRIIYANPCKQESHIRYACNNGVQMMTFDCEEELVKIVDNHKNAKLVLRISVDDSKAALRLSSKFGTPLWQWPRLLERAKELCLEVIGISFHVGSGCSDPKAFSQAISDAHKAFTMGVELGFNMTLLDIGGGFPGSENTAVKFEDFAAEINLALDTYFPAQGKVKIIAEPGRYYVASSYTLALNIIGKKAVMKNHNDGNKGIMYYVNDGIHGSFNMDDPVNSNIQPYLHKKSRSDHHPYPSAIWGPTCDSFDLLVKHLFLPEMEVGDWLLVDNMGAYTCVMGSNFNGFRRADTYFVMSQDNLLTFDIYIPITTLDPHSDRPVFPHCHKCSVCVGS
uniref:ornithine decarboxylase n=1 Tax=Denticeps clupeoides TaxID=299321 RepID=A0AAY4CKL8_9TELE